MDRGRRGRLRPRRVARAPAGERRGGRAGGNAVFAEAGRPRRAGRRARERAPGRAARDGGAPAHRRSTYGAAPSGRGWHPSVRSLGIDRGGVACRRSRPSGQALFAYLVPPRPAHPPVTCSAGSSGRAVGAQARKSLRTTLWRIRSVIEAGRAAAGRSWSRGREQIGFAAAARVWVDVWELEDSVRMWSGAGTARRADGPRLGWSPTWPRYFRRPLRRLVLAAADRLRPACGARAGSRSTAAGPGTGSARSRADVRSCATTRSGGIHRALMACHHAMGDRPSALRQYRECALVLRDQLAIRPMEETRALYARIRGAI